MLVPGDLPAFAGQPNIMLQQQQQPIPSMAIPTEAAVTSVAPAQPALRDLNLLLNEYYCTTVRQNDTGDTHAHTYIHIF